MTLQGILLAFVLAGLASLLRPRVAITLLALWLTLLTQVALLHASEPPDAARPYQRALTREARALWGLDAPVAVLAGQVEQESAWDPSARSSFASGLAQFTPATAAWISGAYPKDLAGRQPLNPEWALRALVRYDFDLVGNVTWAKAACDRWAFALSGYNGGPGWVKRDRAMCAATGGCDPDRWWGNVELYSPRSLSALKENRGYPRRILRFTQAHYANWGGKVSC